MKCAFCANKVWKIKQIFLFLFSLTVNVGNKMNGAIGYGHTESQEDVNLNGGWVSSTKCRKGH
jgi:hypothetical protein